MKVDPKIRFQKSGFRKNLEEARNYKRQTKKIPETSLGIFLNTIGLGSIWAKIFFVLFISFVVYLVFFPNWFTVKEIAYISENNQTKNEVANIINNFFKDKTPYPKNNWLLFSQKTVSNHIKKQNLISVKNVNVKKNFPNKLTLEIETREPKLVLANSDISYVLGDDGFIMETSNSTNTDTSLLIINLKEKENLKVKDHFIHAQDSIALFNFFKDVLKNPSLNMNLKSLKIPELTIKTQSGYDAVFNLNNDTQEALKQLQLLLSHLEPSQKTTLKYVDLTAKDKAFVCYQNTPCAQEPQTPLNNASSTPTNLE